MPKQKTLRMPYNAFFRTPLYRYTNFTYVGTFGWVACGSSLKLDNLSVYSFGTHEKGRKKQHNLGRCSRNLHTESKDQHAETQHEKNTQIMKDDAPQQVSIAYSRRSGYVSPHNTPLGKKRKIGLSQSLTFRYFSHYFEVIPNLKKINYIDISGT